MIIEVPFRRTTDLVWLLRTPIASGYSWQATRISERFLTGDVSALATFPCKAIGTGEKMGSSEDLYRGFRDHRLDDLCGKYRDHVIPSSICRLRIEPYRFLTVKSLDFVEETSTIRRMLERPTLLSYLFCTSPSPCFRRGSSVLFGLRRPLGSLDLEACFWSLPHSCL